jgi:lysozyme family protein
VTNIAALKIANARRWQEMKVRPELVATIDRVAARLAAPDAKAHYAKVATLTHVPWFIIAVIHEREASQSWKANIAQGDPWNTRSRHVPKGRGPFKSWDEAAVDALTNCGPYAARWTDWTAGGALTLLEQYNGLGYANRSLPSPYIWASTDQYTRGKYVADGRFDARAVDRQLGCAALIFRMATMDESVVFQTPSTA